MLDTLSRVPTPEGFELTLRLAGPVPRALAYALDLAIRGLVLFAAATALPYFGRGGTGLLLLCVFLLEWFYPVAFEVWAGGATPGKRAFGLAVLNDNGTPVGFGASVTRNLLRAADFLPVLYAFGLVSMICTRQFQRLGDLAAGTIVVYRERALVRTPLPVAPPLAPPFALTLDERRAVLDFAERHATLSGERADELAAHATPLVAASPRPAAVLLGIANYQRGGTGR
ncbi:MAG: RDD family protein [Burkholderiales bacterium]|nr:RDD family protein [Burkholderiales bacterium]